jgi:hypothetical protein
MSIVGVIGLVLIIGSIVSIILKEIKNGKN